jgi:hypothetical protein
MNGENYIADAKAPEEHLSNVEFQAANVKGWLGRRDMECALVKAQCLLRDVECLVAKLEAINRTEKS